VAAAPGYRTSALRFVALRFVARGLLRRGARHAGPWPPLPRALAALARGPILDARARGGSVP